MSLIYLSALHHSSNNAIGSGVKIAKQNMHTNHYLNVNSIHSDVDKKDIVNMIDTPYSHLLNTQGGSNKRGGWVYFLKINKQP